MASFSVPLRPSCGKSALLWRGKYAIRGVLMDFAPPYLPSEAGAGFLEKSIY
jgi:hypothetical protein